MPHRSNPMHAAMPTKAQKEAGNYRMAHVRVHGLDITIETPKGRRRRPEWPPMACHYGYFKRTEARDGDNVDVFIGPNRDSELVYVIDQYFYTAKHKFDESKVLMGFDSQKQAVDTYLACYKPDWKIGPVTAMTIEQFKNWLKEGDTMKPIAPQVSKYSILADLHLPFDPAPFIERYQQQCVKDRYEWIESQHPRHEAGTPGGVGGQFRGREGGSSGYVSLQKQFHPDMKSFGEENAEAAAAVSRVRSMPGAAKSSKIRDVADPPTLPREHPLHWSNAGEYAQKIYDWHFALHRELRDMTTAHTWNAKPGEERDHKWEQAWQAGDKTRIRELLNEMNAMDKEARAKGINLSDYVNASGLMPRELAERMASGSRFFDPERIRDKIKDGFKQSGVKPKPPEPKKEPQPQPSAMPDSRESLHSTVQSAFDKLRKPDQKKVDDAIRSLDEDIPSDMVADLREAVMDAWRQATQEASEHNQALREVMGQAGKNWGTMSARLAKGADYGQIKGFDQLAEYGLLVHKNAHAMIDARIAAHKEEQSRKAASKDQAAEKLFKERGKRYLQWSPGSGYKLTYGYAMTDAEKADAGLRKDIKAISGFDSDSSKFRSRDISEKTAKAVFEKLKHAGSFAGSDNQLREISESQWNELIKAEADAKRAKSKSAKEREAELKAVKVPSDVLAAYRSVRGNPENLPDDIDNPMYWAIRRYEDAIEAQGLASREQPKRDTMEPIDN